MACFVYPRVGGGGQAFEVCGAGAICSFEPLDVSGVETLVVGNYPETREHFTQALRSLVNLCSLTLWECDNEMGFHALRQEGTLPLLRYLAIDSHTDKLRVSDLLEMEKVRKLRDQKLETLSFEVSSHDDLVGDISSLQEHVGSVRYTTGSGDSSVSFLYLTSRCV